jgi:hypothetical protein
MPRAGSTAAAPSFGDSGGTVGGGRSSPQSAPGPVDDAGSVDARTDRQPPGDGGGLNRRTSSNHHR